MTIWHYILYVDTYITIQGLFQIKVNKLILLGWLPRISIVKNLGKIMDKKRFSPKVVFLPLKTMFRYGFLEYYNHLRCFFGGSIDDFEDYV